jgi:hypothetical protein
MDLTQQKTRSADVLGDPLLRFQIQPDFKIESRMLPPLCSLILDTDIFVPMLYILIQ